METDLVDVIPPFSDGEVNQEKEVVQQCSNCNFRVE